MIGQAWGYIWSQQGLFSRKMLWLLVIANALGTIYGYIWYGGQLVDTYHHYALWLLPFVPDSPTASLFFTFSLLFMIADKSPVWQASIHHGPIRALRAFVDAFAIVTLIKYGVWAVTMNIADGWQGGTLTWQQWMLIASHAAMALEALMFAQRMRYGPGAIIAVAIWSLSNDYVDYHIGVHPYLFGPLLDDIATIEIYTWSLSLISIAAAWKLRTLKRLV